MLVKSFGTNAIIASGPLIPGCSEAQYQGILDGNECLKGVN